MRFENCFVLAVCLALSLVSSANAGPLSDKFFEAVDTAKEKSQHAMEGASRVYRDKKEKIKEAYQDYRERKKMEAEREKREKERINNAVNDYEEQLRKKNTPGRNDKIC